MKHGHSHEMRGCIVNAAISFFFCDLRGLGNKEAASFYKWYWGLKIRVFAPRGWLFSRKRERFDARMAGRSTCVYACNHGVESKI